MTTRKQRRYSYDELKTMREALTEINTPIGVSYYQRELDALVEAQLQTHMLNGTDPEALVKAKAEHRERSMVYWRRNAFVPDAARARLPQDDAT